MPLIRIIMLVFCASVLAGGFYLSSQGVWGASKSTVSVREGTYNGGVGAGRVK